jgi:hypothetical protein
MRDYKEKNPSPQSDKELVCVLMEHIQESVVMEVTKHKVLVI